MFNLKGRVAVITGASSGLGRQMARGFAGLGADLVILARRIERLEELKEELEKTGVKVLPIKCDVTSTEDIDNAAQLAEKEFGQDLILSEEDEARQAVTHEEELEYQQFLEDEISADAEALLAEFGDEDES